MNQKCPGSFRLTAFSLSTNWSNASSHGLFKRGDWDKVKVKQSSEVVIDRHILLQCNAPCMRSHRTAGRTDVQTMQDFRFSHAKTSTSSLQTSRLPSFELYHPCCMLSEAILVDRSRLCRFHRHVARREVVAHSMNWLLRAQTGCSKRKLVAQSENWCLRQTAHWWLRSHLAPCKGARQ